MKPKELLTNIRGNHIIDIVVEPKSELLIKLTEYQRYILVLHYEHGLKETSRILRIDEAELDELIKSFPVNLTHR